MIYLVHIQKERIERVYTEEGLTRYEAAMKAVGKFLTEFNLPGKPYQYWGSNERADELVVSVRNGEVESPEERRL